MDTLVLFFSQTGKTRAVAEGVAEALGARLEAITLSEEAKVVKPLGGRWTKDDLPPVSCRVENLDAFSRIILGGPVWAFNIAPPVLSLVTKMSWKGKSVAVFLTEFGMGGRRALRTLREALTREGAQVTEARIFSSAFKSRERLKEQGKAWAKTLRK